MSDMVEKVARALWNAESVRATDRPRRVEWAEESEKTQENWRHMARAAIEALREPTEEMCNDGWDVGRDMVASYGFAIGGETPIWQAMIDTALEGPAITIDMSSALSTKGV
jgi:hypothetical protein